MTLTVIVDGIIRAPQPTPTLCTVQNNTLMHCPSPSIDPSILGVLGRKKRSAEMGSLFDDVMDSLSDLGLDVDGHVGGRVKRQSINSETYKFEIGFILDGVPTYRNVTEALGKQ